jgi:hypothetical protein
MRSVRTEPNPELTAAVTAARIAVTDLMLFVGVDPDEARAASREEERKQPEPEVPAPASRTGWLRALRRWIRALRRWFR